MQVKKTACRHIGVSYDESALTYTEHMLPIVGYHLNAYIHKSNQQEWRTRKFGKKIQIVKTVSGARDNAVGIFDAIFPSQQEGRSYKS